MAAEVLLDTGAILALLDKRDRWHRVCTRAYQQLRLPFLTSEAVLSELFHLLRRSRTENKTAWDMISSGTIIIAPIANEELSTIRNLMAQYYDLPMYFADATLVHLAARESISAIFTVDQNDFATYRINGKRRFYILPAERP